ncbi:MAG: hypothetical protein A3J97_11155 [Spirochaetes bacterium RIFOXYC1_FULL_54_7]|nr:MAG: hypothetical protein A3J97_11155 [Spirochaetes bacterium RIFOXYC1_FULL_54_7]
MARIVSSSANSIKAFQAGLDEPKRPAPSSTATTIPLGKPEGLAGSLEEATAIRYGGGTSATTSSTDSKASGTGLARHDNDEARRTKERIDVQCKRRGMAGTIA